MTYLQSLSRELRAVAIPERLRGRILAEIADHLRCDPEADLGPPRELARQFADELGTSLARRAALTVFAALACAGLAFAGSFLAHTGALRSVGRAPQPLGDLAALLIVIAPQVAFVAGGLAAIRALRRSRRLVVPRAEATIILRRAGTGLAAGLASMLGFALLAVALVGRAPGWWVALTLSLSGAGVFALLAAAPSVIGAAKLRPIAPGARGDLFDDLGILVPRRLRGAPWRLALCVAGALVAVIAFAGVLQSDPFDGVIRGIADGGACLVGFLVLGRYLGLRR